MKFLADMGISPKTVVSSTRLGIIECLGRAGAGASSSAQS